MRKLIFSIFLFNYINIVAFGFLSHQIYHHFKDNSHHHSMACVNEIINDSLHDDDSVAGPAISDIQCQFESLTKEFHRLNTFDTLENYVLDDKILVQEFLRSVTEPGYQSSLSGLQKNKDPPLNILC